jgi:hypothetical protein
MEISIEKRGHHVTTTGNRDTKIARFGSSRERNGKTFSHCYREERKAGNPPTMK